MRYTPMGKSLSESRVFSVRGPGGGTSTWTLSHSRLGLFKSSPSPAFRPKLDFNRSSIAGAGLGRVSLTLPVQRRSEAMANICKPCRLCNFMCNMEQFFTILAICTISKYSCNMYNMYNINVNIVHKIACNIEQYNPGRFQSYSKMLT